MPGDSEPNAANQARIEGLTPAPTGGSGFAEGVEAPPYVAKLTAEAALALGRCQLNVSEGKVIVREIAAAYDQPIEVELFPTAVFTEQTETDRVSMRSVFGSYRFDQMANVQRVLEDARTLRLAPLDAVEQLRAIALARPPLPAWLRVVGYALSAVGFGACFRLDFRALLLGAIVGVLVGVAVLLGSGNRQLAALMPVLATFVSALLVSVGTGFLHAQSDSVRLAAAAVLVLLPGATLTSATIELVSGDMVSGASRLVFGIMQLLAMAFGFLLAMDLVGSENQRLADVTSHMSPPWVPWIGCVAYAIGTMLYFCTPLAFWLDTLVVVAIAFSAQALAQLVVSPALASGVAAALAYSAAWWISFRKGGGPVSLVLFVPAYWLLVPGSASFVAVAGAVVDNTNLQDIGSEAAISVLAMSIGIMVASLVLNSLSSGNAGHSDRPSRPAS
ncbi:MAG: threonine/serine exporter family protein [Actinomycetes bacterium]